MAIINQIVFGGFAHCKKTQGTNIGMGGGEKKRKKERKEKERKKKKNKLEHHTKIQSFLFPFLVIFMQSISAHDEGRTAPQPAIPSP